MSLDFYLKSPSVGKQDCQCFECGNQHKRDYQTTLFDRNITHNLGAMFGAAGVYEILWHGDGKVARDVLPQLSEALKAMKADPERFERFDASNGWGTYSHAVDFLAAVIRGCEENPDGVIYCSR